MVNIIDSYTPFQFLLSPNTDNTNVAKIVSIIRVSNQTVSDTTYNQMCASQEWKVL